MLWIGIILISALTLAILVLPSIIKSRKPDDAARQDYDAAVYRDQLAEVDRDLERGMISETEAETARVEIQRRLLAAVDGNTDQEYLVGGKLGFVIPTLSLIVFIGALVLYLEMGSPDTPDFPYAARDDLGTGSDTGTETADSMESIEAAVSQLEARLQDNPDDPDGWAMLGRTYMSLQQYTDAQTAYLKLYEITGDIMAKGEYAEAVILANNAQIMPETLNIFEEVMHEYPYEPKSRFYFGVAAAQQGNLEGALQIWIDLLHLSPPGAAWIDIVQQQVFRAASDLGIDPSTIEPTEMAAKLAEEAGIQSGGLSAPASPAAPGPSQEDIENAQQMTDDEQMEMIRSMVQRLADRLQSEPDDYEGWLRLAQAYEVLGETGKAEEARQRAAEVAP